MLSPTCAPRGCGSRCRWPSMASTTPSRPPTAAGPTGSTSSAPTAGSPTGAARARSASGPWSSRPRSSASSALDRRRPERRLPRPRAEGVERLRLAPALDAVGDVLAERRPVLEAVAGAAADEPPAVALGMRRDEEVRVAGEAVLADPRPDDRRAGQCGEAARGVLACGALV